MRRWEFFLFFLFPTSFVVCGMDIIRPHNCIWYWCVPDCKKVICPQSLCPNGSKRVRVDDNCCGCRKLSIQNISPNALNLHTRIPHVYVRLWRHSSRFSRNFQRAMRWTGKNPVCPAVRTLLTKTGLWSNKKSWQNDLVPKKVDVATVTKSSAKFYLVAGKGDVALDLRIQNNNADLVVGKAKQGMYFGSPKRRNN